MQVTVRGKNIEPTAALREYVQTKIGRLAKFLDQPLDAEAKLQTERGRHRIEVTININGLVLRGEEVTDDMYAAIDLVSEKLEKQILKYKERFRQRSRERGAAEPLPDAEGTVVKTKRFAVSPLTVAEAILQLNLLGHDFFLFSNSATGRLNVLYRRKDGQYGLLVPDSPC